MSLSWRPRVTCYVDNCISSMRYYLPEEVIVVECDVQLQRDLLRYCSGYYELHEIIEVLSCSYPLPSILSLVELLQSSGALVDAQECWRAFHAYGNNPMPLFKRLSDDEMNNLYNEVQKRQPVGGFLPVPTTPFAKLLCSRRTSRQFTGAPLKRQEVRDLCWSACGVVGSFAWESCGLLRRTIPSAGALYPLMLHVLVTTPSPGLDSGVYSYTHDIHLLTKWQDTTAFHGCFMKDTYVDTCGACFVISGDVPFVCRKYGDRGYRYTILEAGHAAQNLQIFCAECGLGCVEVGGFFDRELSAVLNLLDGVVPLTVVLAGRLEETMDDC